MVTVKEARDEIARKAEEVSKTHPGGESFFDALDKKIIETCSDDIIRVLFGFVPEGAHIVLSGGFGKRVADGIDREIFPGIPYHLYEGGIRNGADAKLLRVKSSRKEPSMRIFLDDSIYGGLTFRILQKQYKVMSAPLEFCAVIYDGCPVSNPRVKSIYRYYDFHNPKPNFKF